MSTQGSSRILLGLVGAATVAALVVPGAALAKGKPPDVGPGEESTNNLSVPAVFVGSMPFEGLTCDGNAESPDGQTPATGYTLAGYYYVQGENTWQAGCIIPDVQTAIATATFGDNLTGTAKKSVGSPIRVELNLFESPSTPMVGWDVVKLEPAQLDRLSPYGTLATADTLGGFASSPTTTLPTRVWAPGTLKIYLLSTPASPVVNTAAAAEINSTGKVVFGYNLRVTAAGIYVIEYTFPDVTITSVPKGDISNDGHTVSLPIDVTAGGGGGGKRK